jgi:hypothetical protein
MSPTSYTDIERKCSAYLYDLQCAIIRRMPSDAGVCSVMWVYPVCFLQAEAGRSRRDLSLCVVAEECCVKDEATIEGSRPKQ